MIDYQDIQLFDRNVNENTIFINEIFVFCE